MLTCSRVTNKFYDPGDQRAAKVGDLFTAIAPRYDLINDLQSLGLHRHWKRRLLKLAAGLPANAPSTSVAAPAMSPSPSPAAACA